MREPVVRIRRAVVSVLYGGPDRLAVRVAAQDVAEAIGGVAATVGAYRIDEQAFAEGLAFFRRDQFVESRAAFSRADPATRDARTQFYVAYSYYRQGWHRTHHDDAAVSSRAGSRSTQAIALAPDGRLAVDDPNLLMRSADELKAELEAGPPHRRVGFQPAACFREPEVTRGSRSHRPPSAVPDGRVRGRDPARRRGVGCAALAWVARRRRSALGVPRPQRRARARTADERRALGARESKRRSACSWQSSRRRPQILMALVPESGVPALVAWIVLVLAAGAGVRDRTGPDAPVPRAARSCSAPSFVLKFIVLAVTVRASRRPRRAGGADALRGLHARHDHASARRIRSRAISCSRRRAVSDRDFALLPAASWSYSLLSARPDRLSSHAARASRTPARRRPAKLDGDRREGGGVERRNAKQQALEKRDAAAAPARPERDPDERRDASLSEHHRQHCATPGAERHADADFAACARSTAYASTP